MSACTALLITLVRRLQRRRHGRDTAPPEERQNQGASRSPLFLESLICYDLLPRFGMDSMACRIVASETHAVPIVARSLWGSEVSQGRSCRGSFGFV